MNFNTNSSVAGLARTCTSKFSELLKYKCSILHNPLQNRAADFHLWADGVGAIARPGASLDSRFHDRPNDLILIKGILVMLIDFLSEVSMKDPCPDTALVNVDSALSNLAMIGIAIRRTGKASRSRRADQSFNPDHYRLFRRHLECMILLRPSEETSRCNGLNADGAIDDEILDARASRIQDLFSRRLSHMDGSNLTELQLRLIDANLRRRHRFILAQQRSQHNKAAYTPKAVTPEAKNRSISLAQGTVTASAERKRQEPPTIVLTASTAEGTMRFNPVGRPVQTVAQSQISSLGNDIEFPRISLPLPDRHIIECPCCCQPLPFKEVRTTKVWRQHLIEDICPYSCVAEKCPTPHLLFATRKAWDHHIENDHPCQWECVLCGHDGSDRAIFSSASDITSHIKSSHQDDLCGQSVSDIVGWSRVHRMGIKSCPLCASYGPEDSPELIEHVVRHAYDFALRALPWPHTPAEELNKPIGTYSIPKDGEEAARLMNWLEHSQAECGAGHNLELSPFDHADHDVLMAQEPAQEDYFDSHVYFDQTSAAGSQLAAPTEMTDREVSDQPPQLSDHSLKSNINAIETSHLSVESGKRDLDTPKISKSVHKPHVGPHEGRQKSGSNVTNSAHVADGFDDPSYLSDASNSDEGILYGPETGEDKYDFRPNPHRGKRKSSSNIKGYT